MCEMQGEKQALESLVYTEDIAEKKMNIFARLLIQADLAQDLESVAQRHAARKQTLLSLLGKEDKKGGKDK